MPEPQASSGPSQASPIRIARPSCSILRINARSCIRKGARGRCYNVIGLVNHREAELRAGRQGRTAEQLVRRDFVILDELGYLAQ